MKIVRVAKMTNDAYYRPMMRVCIESPLKGDLEGNVQYARTCLRHVLDEGHAPFASHLLYTQVLDDRIEAHRELGITAGLAHGDACDERWFFVDKGWSEGMYRAMEHAETIGQPARCISLDKLERVKSLIGPTPYCA